MQFNLHRRRVANTPALRQSLRALCFQRKDSLMAETNPLIQYRLERAREALADDSPTLSYVCAGDANRGSEGVNGSYGCGHVHDCEVLSKRFLVGAHVDDGHHANEDGYE